LIEKHKVKGFYTAPTAVRFLRKEDPNSEWMKKYDLSSLKIISMAGERSSNI
jgi:propionyl-CoA synthetase